MESGIYLWSRLQNARARGRLCKLRVQYYWSRLYNCPWFVPIKKNAGSGKSGMWNTILLLNCIFLAKVLKINHNFQYLREK